jgi:hypothetical protein
MSGIVLGSTARIPQATQDLVHRTLIEIPKSFFEKLRTALGELDPIVVAAVGLFGVTEVARGLPSAQLSAWISEGTGKLRNSKVVKMIIDWSSNVARGKKSKYVTNLPSWFDQELEREVSLVLRSGEKFSGSIYGVREMPGRLNFLKLKEKSPQEGTSPRDGTMVLVKIDEIVMLRGREKPSPDVPS